MTDRVKAFVITLERDIEIDDVQILMQTIRAMRGIVDVKPSIDNVNDYIISIETRIKNKLKANLFDFIKENF